MRELILKMSMSLDGFVAGPKGEAEWVFGADQEARGLGPGDGVERQSAHHGQPHLP